MLWGRGNVPATPGQLRALFDDPLCKKLIYQLWTAQALAKLGGDAQGDPEDPLSLSDLTDRQMGMINEAAEAIDRECIPYDVDKLVPTDPPCPQQQQHLSPRTVIVACEGQAEGQAVPGEGTSEQEATQRRRAEERRYRLVIELRRRSDEEAERRSTATVMPACVPTRMVPPPPPPPPLELLPLELLGLLLVFLPAVEDVAACLCAARLFGSAWGGASAEAALELRAAVAGEAITPPPGWADSTRAWLGWRERRRRAASWQALLAAGTHHSALVDRSGQLCTCGAPTPEGQLLAGHGGCSAGEAGPPPPAPAAGAGSRGGAPLERAGAMTSGPERLSALLGVRIRSVATSGQFSLALSMGGEVYAWGYGGEGQLGQGDESSRAAPTLIEELLHETVACIAVGDDHALAATEGGALYSWGYGIDGRLGLTEAEGRLLPELVSELSGVSVKGVAAGRWHSLARTADGALYSWGGGGFGRLGHGDEASLRLPTRVAALSGVHVVGMAAGAHHTLALSDAGRLYSWGLGGNGRLGHGDTELRLLPTPIAALVQRHVIVTCLAAGAHHSLAVTDQGALLTWGDGGGGRLGRGDINSLVGV
jgi:hypothetical protein